jgi:hypothetical protein
MIRDNELTFSNGQTITGAAISSNIVDLGAAKDMVPGRQPWVVAQLTEALTDSGNNSSISVIFQTDSLAAFNSATNVQTIGTFATNAAVGAKVVVPVPSVSTQEQYVGLYYDVAGGNFTTGKVTAFITFDPHLYTAYPDAVTVSVP